MVHCPLEGLHSCEKYNSDARFFMRYFAEDLTAVMRLWKGEALAWMCSVLLWDSALAFSYLYSVLFWDSALAFSYLYSVLFWVSELAYACILFWDKDLLIFCFLWNSALEFTCTYSVLLLDSARSFEPNRFCSLIVL